MKNKKSMAINTLVFLIIAVFVILVVIFILTHLFGQEKDDLEGGLKSTGDYDGDGISNYFDRCPCHPGKEEDNGCGAAYILPVQDGYTDAERDACRTIIYG